MIKEEKEEEKRKQKFFGKGKNRLTQAGKYEKLQVTIKEEKEAKRNFR